MARFMSSSSWSLEVRQDWIDVTSEHPTPNERWTFTDSSGHEHRYSHGYQTLDLVVDGSHWCDGHEGPWNHDPHEAIDEAHYECLICREVVTPKMDPPYTPKQKPGMRSARLTGYRSDGLKVTAELTQNEIDLVTSPAFDPTEQGIALILDRVDDYQIIEIASR